MVFRSNLKLLAAMLVLVAIIYSTSCDGAVRTLQEGELSEIVGGGCYPCVELPPPSSSTCSYTEPVWNFVYCDENRGPDGRCTNRLGFDCGEMKVSGPEDDQECGTTDWEGSSCTLHNVTHCIQKKNTICKDKFVPFLGWFCQCDVTGSPIDVGTHKEVLCGFGCD